MAQIIPPKVNPGDLITAGYINQLIDTLSGLDQRVSKLESTGSVANPVSITGFAATQPVHVGDQIEIDGSGFIVPGVLNQVTMGGVQVTNLTSSLISQNRLVFNVPAIPGVTSAGIPVSVSVTNSNGSATSSFQILVYSPSTAPKGRTQLGYAVPPVMPVAQPNITAGQSYTFGFTLTAVTDHDAVYAVTPSITGTGWSAQLVDTSPAPVPAGTTVTMRVSVTAAAGTGILSLTAVETTPGSQVAPGNAQITIAAGSPPQVPENRVRVALAGASLGASVSGTGVAFTRNSLGVIGYTVLFNEGGTYSASVAMLTADGWTQGTLTPGAPFPVNAPPQGGPPTQATVAVQYTAGATAAATSLVLTVTRPADGLTVQYGLPVTVN